MCECVYADTLTPEPILRALFRSDRQTGKQARETRVIKISSTDPSVGRARHYATTTTPGGVTAVCLSVDRTPKAHREARGTRAQKGARGTDQPLGDNGTVPSLLSQAEGGMTKTEQI